MVLCQSSSLHIGQAERMKERTTDSAGTPAQGQAGRAQGQAGRAHSQPQSLHQQVFSVRLPVRKPGPHGGCRSLGGCRDGCPAIQERLWCGWDSHSLGEGPCCGL